MPQVLANRRQIEQTMLWLLSACDGNAGMVSGGVGVPQALHFVPGSRSRWWALELHLCPQVQRCVPTDCWLEGGYLVTSALCLTGGGNEGDPLPCLLGKVHG